MSPQVDDQRRRLLRVVAISPIAAVLAAGCATDRARKGVPRRLPDGDSHVRWRTVRAERELLTLHAATADKHPTLAERLGPMVAHHKDHLAAVLADGPLPIAASGLPEPRIGAIEDEQNDALSAIREAERTMSDRHAAGCIAASGGSLAALLGSIAASEAAHATAL